MTAMPFRHWLPRLVLPKLAFWLGLSMAMAGAMAGSVLAHEVRPAVADVALGADRVDLTIRLSIEPMIAGMDLFGLDDTSNSPKAAQYDSLRRANPATLEAAFRAAWPGLARQFTVLAGTTRLVPEIISLSIPEVGNTALPRDSVLTLTAALPDDGTAVQIGWGAAFGALAVRQVGSGEDAYSGYLQGGTLSAALPREGFVTEGMLPVFGRYIVSGFGHIVPNGLDHILFVLGLFFFALQLRPILAQITAFTLAHTVTLALASLKIITVPASIVEPLIAASIVYVALENILGGRLGWGRIAVVFCFGLLHGLGFASVLSDVGLQSGRFIVGLIGFNIGVELGQLAVISVALLALGLPFGKKPWYRSKIAVPLSALIALIGAWWTVQRVFLS